MKSTHFDTGMYGPKCYLHIKILWDYNTKGQTGVNRIPAHPLHLTYASLAKY